MTTASDLILSSDYDAFKYSGVRQTTSLTLSGTLAASSTLTASSSTFTVADIDYGQIMYDNSIYHPGLYHNINEGRTFVFETTLFSDLTIIINTVVTSTTIRFDATVTNPYSSDVTILSTTLNFSFVPYEATIV